MKRKLLIIYILLLSTLTGFAQQDRFNISGTITQEENGEAIEFATVVIEESGAWAISDKKGNYDLKDVVVGTYTFHVSIMGYATIEKVVEISHSTDTLNFQLQVSSLSIEEVTVSAERPKTATSTSYVIEKDALDHLQPLNLNDISALLPGGKVNGDENLASSDDRLALRSGGNTGANASFGTAIEVDGVRISNNASFGDVLGSSTRNISLVDVSSIEVITGIASVEYGDMTNGIVRVSTAKGRSPYTASVTLKPNTKQFSLSKGFEFNNDGGILNVSLDRTQSVSNLLSPYTAYQRNNINLNYNKKFSDSRSNPILLSAGVSGNLGGYNSESDPDQLLETYTKQRDNAIRANIRVNWQANLSWLSNVEFFSSAYYNDRLYQSKTSKSSSATTVAIHSSENGYFAGEYWDIDSTSNITLLRPGYWFQEAITDSKQLSISAKIKAKHDFYIGKKLYNNVLFGIDFSTNGNLGKGLYYADPSLAPTWREFDYSEQPFTNNIALYLEDNIKYEFNNSTDLLLMAGLRSDITYINGSEYGVVANLSPRFNLRYTMPNSVFWAGWGRSVKLPSSSVLYPQESYVDNLAFVSQSNAAGEAYYAYSTIVNKALYNPNLKWQDSYQTEVGTEFSIGRTKVSLSTYYNLTKNQYNSQSYYSPYSYNLTSQEHLNDVEIPSANRGYTIDPITGIVTVYDKTGEYDSQALSYNTLNTFLSQSMTGNGSDMHRFGVEYIVNFAKIEALKTTIRLDGNYTYYKTVDELMYQSRPSSTTTMLDGSPYQYIGYYYGGASSANGYMGQQVNANMTLTTHIPKIRMIFSVRLESTLYSYKQNLSERDGSSRGYIISSAAESTGTTGDIYDGKNYVAIYPDYYTTWNNPDEQIPFYETFMWAKDNDAELYRDLSQLVVKTNTDYYFTPQTITPYFSVNLSVTKEFGNFASATFYATNFLNNMGKVKSSWSSSESSLYGSSYIPNFYYGLSIKIKL